MRAFLIGLLCLGVYTVPARYYYVCEYRDDCKTTESNARNQKLPERPNDLELQEAEGNDIPKGYEHFAFYKGESDPELSANNKDFLKGIAKYLKANPNSRIAITGDYYKGEKSDDKSTDNMGIARAKKVIKELVALGFKPNRFKAGSNQLDAAKLLNRPVSFTAQSLPDRPNDLALKLEGKAGKDLPKGYDHFAFYKGYSDPEFSANNEDFLKGIAKYLKDNPDSRLGVTGYYYKGEKSDHPTIDNMGIARATKIIDKLVDMGFERSRFRLDSKQLEGNEILNRPISFTLLDGTTAKGEEELVEASYTFERMTFSDVNFDKGSDVLKPTTQFNNYVNDVKTYIDKNPDKTVTVVGHADSDGAELMNYNLGLARSRTVRAYLVGKGIDGKKIKNDSKGEKTPIAPNNNEENMRKNRRVEIIIK